MPHVLVFEDEKDSRDFIAQYLRREGHTVSIAADGETALHKLITERVDLVVLDLTMPGMNGIELLEVMRVYLRLQAMPVIIVTGNANADDLRKVWSLGVAHVFYKGSFNLTELGKAIETCCNPPDGGSGTTAR
jgi:CheY-like chemotaxis protein